MSEERRTAEVSVMEEKEVIPESEPAKAPAIEIDEYTLAIPSVVASEFARPGTLLFDELLSEGHFVLLSCVRRFDPSLGVPLACFAFASIRKRLRGWTRTPHERRWRLIASASLDAPMGSGGKKDTSLGSLCSYGRRADDHPARIAAVDEAERFLSRLDTRRREAARLHWMEGMTPAEVGKRLGVGSHGARRMLDDVRRAAGMYCRERGDGDAGGG